MVFSEMNGTNSASKPRVNSSKRSFRMLSKVGTPKWVSNNRCLAKENAKYRKEIQKLTRIVSEQSIRYRSLEMSWLHRGEALSKIDVAAANLGNHFMKVLESLKEIRTVCQKELNVPFREAFAKDNFIHLRKSMPNVKLDSQSSNTKGQPVHHVNPMVSGIPIITKPTIALKRLKMRQLQENKEPSPVNVPAADSDSGDDSSDVNMGPIAEVSSGAQEMEEQSETSSESPASPSPDNENPVMRIAEVPLERLSISRVSGSHRRSSGVLSGCIIQGNDTVVINSSVQNEKQDVSSNVVYRASTGRISTENSSLAETTRRHSNVSVQKSKCITDQANRQQILFREVYKTNNTRPDSPTPQRTSNNSGRNSSVRKYSASNHARNSEPSTPKNGMNKYSEVFKPLIIALKDVGSCLQNGRLVGIDQLEEGKVKTGASAEQKQLHIGGRTHDNDITLIDTPANDQTHLNFTAGIGTLEYTRTSMGEPKDNSNELQSSLSPEDDFRKRIATEDPLEGPSWRYENGVAPRGSRRTTFKRSYCDSLTEKEKSAEEDQNMRESMCYRGVSGKQNILMTPAEENMESVDMVDMDITGNATAIVNNLSDFSNKSCLEKGPSATQKSRANSREILYISKGKGSDAENSSDADWEPSKKGKNEQRKRARKKEPKKRISKKSASHRNLASKVNTNRGSGNSSQRSSSADKCLSRNSSGDANNTTTDLKLTQAFVHLEILTPEQNNSDSLVQETTRARRRAAPTNFRELSLGKKLRRGDAFFH